MLAGLLLAAGCDLPAPTRTDGPRILRIVPDPAGGPIDRIAEIRIELDRRVAPGSIPQGVVEMTSGDVYVWLDMRLDVVHPALVVRPTDPLDPDVDYQLVVHALRDLDGRTSGDTEPVVFHTSTVATPVNVVTPTWAEVAPSFATCVVAGCHTGPEPVLGLDLSSYDTLRLTALGVAADEVAPSLAGSLGAEVTATLVGMPRIDRRDAARSYLLYKMIGDPHVVGAAMPRDGTPPSEEELERIEDWIQGGAPGP